MTPEDAYWHACTNTPIDEDRPTPRLLWNAFNPITSEMEIGFADDRVVAVAYVDFNPARAAWMYTHGRVLRSR